MPEQVVAGRYRLDSALGRGGMAVVWRGTDLLLTRPVAVKILDLTGPDSDAWSARFEREARTTAALNHPNIVTVFDTGIEGNNAYLVMELLPGPNLAERVRLEGPLPVAEVRSIARQVCSALAAAHGAGVVHRDIKPANISYAENGTVKVLDFGITQLMDDAGRGLTRTDTVMGTADYLAPEQARGGRVDERADLYALGCVLVTLLTGKPPYTAETPVATMLRHANDPIPDVRVARPEVPADLAEIITWLLAKNPDDRPASADEVLDALRGALRPPARATSTTVLPVAPPATSPVPAAAPPPPVQPRRSWTAWLPWLLLLVVIAVAIWIVLSQQGNDTPTPGPTTPPTTTTTRSTPSTTTTTATTSTTSTTTTTPATTTTTSPTSATTATTAAPDPGAALATLSATVDQQATAGNIQPDAADQLHKQMNEIEKALQQNDMNKARNEVDKFGQQVQQLTQNGKINQAGANALVDPYAQMQASVAG